MANFVGTYMYLKSVAISGCLLFFYVTGINYYDVIISSHNLVCDGSAY